MVELPDNFDKKEIDSRIDMAQDIPIKLRNVHRSILHCFYWYGDELQRIGYTLEYVQKNVRWPILYSKLLLSTDPWNYVIEKIKKDKIKIDKIKIDKITIDKIKIEQLIKNTYA